jgi:hypothetical protein
MNDILADFRRVICDAAKAGVPPTWQNLKSALPERSLLKERIVALGGLRGVKALGEGLMTRLDGLNQEEQIALVLLAQPGQGAGSARGGRTGPVWRIANHAWLKRAFGTGVDLKMSVRELYQNSLEAGSTSADFCVTQAGTLFARDNGCGIDPARFERFASLGGSSKGATNMGIGLKVYLAANDLDCRIFTSTDGKICFEGLLGLREDRSWGAVELGEGGDLMRQVKMHSALGGKAGTLIEIPKFADAVGVSARNLPDQIATFLNIRYAHDLTNLKVWPGEFDKGKPHKVEGLLAEYQRQCMTRGTEKLAVDGMEAVVHWGIRKEDLADTTKLKPYSMVWRENSHLPAEAYESLPAGSQGYAVLRQCGINLGGNSVVLIFEVSGKGITSDDTRTHIHGPVAREDLFRKFAESMPGALTDHMCSLEDRVLEGADISQKVRDRLAELGAIGVDVPAEVVPAAPDLVRMNLPGLGTGKPGVGGEKAPKEVDENKVTPDGNANVTVVRSGKRINKAWPDVRFSDPTREPSLEGEAVIFMLTRNMIVINLEDDVVKAHLAKAPSRTVKEKMKMEIGAQCAFALGVYERRFGKLPTPQELMLMGIISPVSALDVNKPKKKR